MHRISQYSTVALTLLLTACGGGGGGGGGSSADQRPTLNIVAASSPEGDAGNQVMTFTVNLSAALSEDVTVNYQTADDGSTNSADASNDYTPANGTVTILASTTSSTFDVPVTGDTRVEFNETFTASLSSASANARIDSASATGTIIDDDAYVLSLSAQSDDEGDSGDKTQTFSASLDKPAVIDFSVDFSTVDLSASAGSDYAASSGTLSFPAGTSTATASIDVTVHGDTRLEADESYGFSIANATAHTNFPAAGSALGTIRNDDQITLSIADNSLNEGDSGSTTALGFAVTLSGGTADVAITVDYATADGSATIADSDYTATSGTLSIPAGQTSGTINVPVIGDGNVEPQQTFSLNLSNATSGVLGVPSSATGSISNDDQPSLSVADVSQPEGDAAGTMTFTVQLDQATLADINFNFVTSDGSATSGSVTPADNDYTAANSSGTITAGSSSATIDVITLGNQQIEPDESFTLTLSGFSAAVTVVDAVAIGTLTDDDTRQISVADVSVNEGDAGNTTATFTIQLEGPAITDVTVGYATSDGTAIAGDDYAAVSSTATILAGASSVDVDVTINGDTVVEGDQNFAFDLSNASSNSLLVDGSATATIANDDTATVTINSPSQAELSDGGLSAMDFTVSLSNTFETDVSIAYTTQDALNPPRATVGFDYIAASGSLNLTAGQTAGSISVQVRGDAAVEPDEMFEVQLSGLPTGAQFGVDVGIGTIQDDDVAQLNDTGITSCANGSGYGLTCNDVGAGTNLFLGQDAEFGLDAQNADPLDGIAGLSLTKLDASGDELPSSAGSWSCVRDNITGLIWEAKTNGGTLRDRAHTYSWFNSDGSTNGSNAGNSGVGTENGGTCSAGSGCDTEKFVADVNASALCGFSDWHLPRVDELRSIIVHGSNTGSGFDVDTNYFPQASGNDIVWTDTSEAANAAVQAWAVDFSGGFQIDLPKFQANSVRLVRGTFLRVSNTPISAPASQTCRGTILPTAPASRFTDNGDDTVTDLDTGLMWKQCPEGLPGPNCDAFGTAAGGGAFDYAAIAYTWQGALQQVQAVNAITGNADVNPGPGDGYGDWRLPNVKELASIMERACVNPAINLSLFPGDYKDRTVDTEPGRTDARFWSASPDASATSCSTDNPSARCAWTVLSHNGDDRRSDATEAQVLTVLGVRGGYSYWVRLVRDAN